MSCSTSGSGPHVRRRRPGSAGEDNLERRPKRPIPREAWLYGSLCVAVAIVLLVGVIRYWPHPHQTWPVPASAQTVAQLRVPATLPKQHPRVTVHTADGKPIAAAAVRYAGHSDGTNAAGEVTLNLNGLAPSRFLIVVMPGFRSVVADFHRATCPSRCCQPSPCNCRRIATAGTSGTRRRCALSSWPSPGR